VRLAELPDFKTLIALSSRELSVPEAWIEKDYYLTEVLRLIARAYPIGGFLKGGTSLTKGWELLTRISEDIDWVLIRGAFVQGLNGKAVNGRLEGLASEVARHPSLSWDKSRTTIVDGKARHDYYDYRTAMATRTLGLAETILVEAGTRAGNWPLEKRTIQSFIGSTAATRGNSDIADDIDGFPMLVLDFRRTFVEKMLAIHGFVERLAKDGTVLGRNARHYADLAVLLQRAEVKSLLESPEFAAYSTSRTLWRKSTSRRATSRCRSHSATVKRSSPKALSRRKSANSTKETYDHSSSGRVCLPSTP